jgi:hypothetical protein
MLTTAKAASEATIATVPTMLRVFFILLWKMLISFVFVRFVIILKLRFLIYPLINDILFLSDRIRP